MHTTTSWSKGLEDELATKLNGNRLVIHNILSNQGSLERHFVAVASIRIKLGRELSTIQSSQYLKYILRGPK
jgi:hypothetical protein